MVRDNENKFKKLRAKQRAKTTNWKSFAVLTLATSAISITQLFVERGAFAH